MNRYVGFLRKIEDFLAVARGGSEILELKKECYCRKPKPGMILQAAKDFNIDLKTSWMIGDSEIDVIEAHKNGNKVLCCDNGGSAADSLPSRIFL